MRSRNKHAAAHVALGNGHDEAQAGASMSRRFASMPTCSMRLRRRSRRSSSMPSSSASRASWPPRRLRSSWRRSILRRSEQRKPCRSLRVDGVARQHGHAASALRLRTERTLLLPGHLGSWTSTVALSSPGNAFEQVCHRCPRTGCLSLSSSSLPPASTTSGSSSRASSPGCLRLRSRLPQRCSALERFVYLRLGPRFF